MTHRKSCLAGPWHDGTHQETYSDEQRLDLYLDDLLGHVRFPLMHTKYVAKLDSHPVAARSKVLTELMLQALKFAVAPKLQWAVRYRFLLEKSNNNRIKPRQKV